MDIAVVIPLYNGERWIRQTLNAVAAQSHAPREVVVVDDGSTDASPSIVADEYPDVRLVRQSENSGPNAARNRGIRETTAEAVAFLDQDDLWHPEHLRILSGILESHPDCVAVLSSKGSFKNDDSPPFAVNNCTAQPQNPWDSYPTNRMGPPTGSLIRRSALAEVEGWASRFEGCSDYYMWLRLALIGTLMVSSCTTAAHRVHGNSHGDRLKNSETLMYYEQLVGASEEALEYRRQHNLPIKNFEPKARAQRALRDFLAASIHGDSAELKKAAVRFEAATEDEPPSTVTNLWDNFRWHVEPYYNSNSADFIYTTLDFLENWPSDAQRTRRILRNWALQRFPASGMALVRRYPFNIEHWNFLTQRLGQRLRDTIATNR